MARVLVVDDEEAGRADLQDALTSEGYEIVAPDSRREVDCVLAQESFDLVVTDIKLDDEGFGDSETGGIGVIEAVKQKDSRTPVIAITGRPDLICAWQPRPGVAPQEVSVGVAAMLSGAFDFIERGVPGIKFRELLRRKVKLALDCRRVRQAASSGT